MATAATQGEELRVVRKMPTLHRIERKKERNKEGTNVRKNEMKTETKNAATEEKSMTVVQIKIEIYLVCSSHVHARKWNELSIHKIYQNVILDGQG